MGNTFPVQLHGEGGDGVESEFGIFRKTGYKIFERYKNHGLEGRSDRSRRRVRNARQLPPQLEAAIVTLKWDTAYWGASKIRDLLLRRLPGDVRAPARYATHAVLDRHGLVKRMGPKRRHARSSIDNLGGRDGSRHRTSPSSSRRT